MAERDFDLILFGATGFVGQLTAAYLAEHADAGLRWAIAGRNEEKLESLRDELAKAHGAPADLPIFTADSSDSETLAHLAARTRVVLSTVGPYIVHGEPLVRACAEAGTAYADLTGEPGFVDEMYLKYDEVARQTGAKLIHCAGFDSIPADLGAYFTLLQLPEGQPVTIESRVRASMHISGGTLNSALQNLGSPIGTVHARIKRGRSQSKPTDRKIGSRIRPLVRDGEMGMWVAPLPTIDQFIVENSAALVDRYGPDFHYGHNFATKRLATIGIGTAAVATTFLASQLPPLRRQLGKRIPPGTGPDAQQRTKNWFRIEFVGRAAGQEVRTAISGGDPGYGETAKMLSELAFALLRDDVPTRSGQLTPVAAAGDALLERLPAAGIKLEVVERS
jgi:saccharopine dehydrogenase (NAD+, L-glutamate forming)